MVKLSIFTLSDRGVSAPASGHKQQFLQINCSPSYSYFYLPLEIPAGFGIVRPIIYASKVIYFFRTPW